jgi:hypothetical protein
VEYAIRSSESLLRGRMLASSVDHAIKQQRWRKPNRGFRSDPAAR